MQSIFILIVLSLFPLTSRASLVSGRYRNAVGSRTYNLYLPSGLTNASGLVVVLHGCRMTPEQMEAGIGLDALADQNKFAILYPRQTKTDNPTSCWNWFEPQSQTRDLINTPEIAYGEASILVGMTRYVTKKYQLDASKVVITGLSAGSAMAANLLGCYSDVFFGGFLASGLTFGAAQDEYSAYLDGQNGSSNDTSLLVEWAWQCSPRRSTLIPVVVIQGSVDQYIATINADQTESFFQELNEKIWTSGDGSADDILKTKTQIAATKPGGYPYLQSDTSFSDHVAVRKIIVQGMAHGWSGGDPAGGPYMLKDGPSAAQILVDYFFNN